MQSSKILIIGPAWIGDMIMAQTLFQQLKQKNPDVEIDVLAPAWTHPLLKRMPEIHHALISPFKHGELCFIKRYQLGKSLRKRRYDQAIVLQNSFKSAFIPFFAKIPRRTGFLGEMRYGLLNDIKQLNKKRLPLMIDRFLALGKSENDCQNDYCSPSYPRLNVFSADVAHTLEKFRLLTSKTPIIALCPGAAYGPAKRWPADYFAKLAKLLLRQNYAVWLFGSKQDEDFAKKIQIETHDRCVNLCGKTTLDEAINLLSAATLAVTNDSGLMHTAAALDKPIVAIYGSSTPDFTPPLQKKAKILSVPITCRPCFKRNCPYGHLKCLYEITPQYVMDAVLQLTTDVTQQRTEF